MAKSKSTQEPQQPQPQSKQEGGTGCLVRLCWMLFGNIALLVSAKLIADHTGFTFSSADIAFWFVVLFLLGIRYIDITKLGGLTATLKPASIGHWRWYAVYLGAFSLALWLVAHVVAYYRK